MSVIHGYVIVSETLEGVRSIHIGYEPSERVEKRAAIRRAGNFVRLDKALVDLVDMPGANTEAIQRLSHLFQVFNPQSRVGNSAMDGLGYLILAVMDAQHEHDIEVRAAVDG